MRPVRARSRLHAWAALVLLALVLGTVVTILVVSQGLLILVVAALSVAVVTVVATAWWALTTRRRWKRRLNALIAAAAAISAVLAVAIFSIRFAGALALLGLLTVSYVQAARHALSGAAADAAGLAARPRPPARPWLLVNPNSGGGKAGQLGLAEAARRLGARVHVLAPGEDVEALALAAVAGGADAVGVAGGDGSLGRVAAVAARSDVPFLCVPAGTRNHFAADLGLDRARPLAALDALDGRERRVDVGTVDGRTFLNNVSLGAYADLVGEASYRTAKLATARAVLPELIRAEETVLDIAFRLQDGQRCTDALVLLVANNPYRPTPLDPGGRPRLDSGLLQVSVLRARTGAQIAAVLSRVATAQAGDPSMWAQWTTPSFRVESAAGEIRVAVDGETMTLAAPLEFEVSPGALRVLVPAGRPRGQFADLLAPLHWSTPRRLWTVARTR